MRNKREAASDPRPLQENGTQEDALVGPYVPGRVGANSAAVVGVLWLLKTMADDILLADRHFEGTTLSSMFQNRTPCQCHPVI